jgi:glycosyltransferase involved in cell wall biosynthesis
VAIEKNLEAFLNADVPGTKVIVGDGPARAHLQARYPDAVFLGTRHGTELASIYASADVFVFSSKTDTFGLVMLEALATGVPVAGYPVQGPLDIIGAEGRGPQDTLDRAIGCLKHDLAEAIHGALSLDRADAAHYGAQFCWDACTNQFVNGITRANHSGALAA